MKTNQAWGWLAAGVLAAGLNASYYDGGFRWAHRIADRICRNSAAALDLASEQTGQFLSEARLLTARNQTTSCPWATAVARVQSRIARSHAGFDVMSARQESQLARLEANRARMEAQIAAQAAHLRIATAALAPVEFKAIPAPVVCPRVRVNIPQIPMIRMPAAPEIHIETASAGPV
ncbi:MAG: hypothetical protein WAN76_08425 [Candidatus Sulfotelmatobacter sp.]